MLDTVDAALQRVADECAEQRLPEGIDALQLLQMEYRGQIVLTHAQRRAAEACLPFERPKLGVVATTNMSSDDFAAMLDRAIARSGKLIEHRPDEGENAKPAQPAPLPPHGQERRGLMGTPDRRFRR
jgi:hypothetical protein